MPPEAAAAATATPAAPAIGTPGVAPAAVVVPPADQPPAPEKPKTWAERWKAAGGDQAEPGEADEGKAAEPAKEPAKAKPEGKAPAAAKPDRRGELETLAKELGFTLDGSAVTVAERADWRERKAKEHAALQAREKAVAELEGKVTTEQRTKIQRAEALLNAFEKGDPDGFATALGVKDFNELQESFIKRLADPNYKELRELQQWREEESRRKAETEQQAEQRAEQQKRAELRTGYMKTLSELSSKSEDTLAATMADDPMFLNVLFQIQSENWDPEEQKTITVEEALDRGVRGSKVSLRQELRGLYERLGKAFGGVAAVTKEAAEVAPSRKGKPAPKTAVTPPKTTEASGGAGQFKTQAEWRAYANKRLAEAIDD